MPLIRPGDHILFQGDSLTDMDRLVPPDLTGGLGRGYPAILAGMFHGLRPDLHVRITNRGVGGDRSAELVQRWPQDCIDLRPDVLSLLVGGNDAWRLIETWRGQTYIDPDAFALNLEHLVRSARDAGIREIILLTPTAVMRDHDHTLNTHIGAYADVVRSTAARHGATVVDIRTPLMTARRNAPELPFTTDGCHPTLIGHGVIAGAWWQTVMGT